MRILRIRRGFTTNSSGSDEYIPVSSMSASRADAGPRTDAAVAPASGPGDAGPSHAVGTHTESASVQTASPLPQGTAPARDFSNGMILGLLAVGVLGAFAVDRALRRIFRRIWKTKAEATAEATAEAAAEASAEPPAKIEAAAEASAEPPAKIEAAAEASAEPPAKIEVAAGRTERHE